MKVTFNTPQGAVEDDFQADKPLKELKEGVLARLRLPPNWADQYIVAFEDNQLDESKTLIDLGIGDNSTLVVWRVSSTSRGRA